MQFAGNNMKQRVVAIAVGVVVAAACAASSFFYGVGKSVAPIAPIATSTPSAAAVQANAPASAASASTAPGMLAPGARVQFGPWRFAGPENLPSQAVSIKAGASGELYALSRDGVVFRSTDDAASWSTMDLPVPQSGAQIAIVPAQGDRPQSIFVRANFQNGLNLFRLVEGEPMQTVPRYDTWSVAVIGTTVYAAAAEGLYRSDDGGASWQIAIALPWGERCSAVAGQGDSVYAICGTYTLYRSLRGAPFEAVYNFSSVYPDELYVAPSNPRVVYAVFRMTKSAILLRSDDSGATFNRTMWADEGESPANQSLLGDLDRLCVDRNYQQTYQSDVAFGIDPANANVVWVGSTHLYRSDDGGATFGRASLSPGSSPAGHSIAGLMRDLAITSGALYVATDDGIHVSRNPRAALQTFSNQTCASSSGPPAVTWARQSEGYNTQRILVSDALPSGEVLARVEARDMSSGLNGLYYGDLDTPDGWLRMATEAPEVIAIDPVLGMDRFYTTRCNWGQACRWSWDAGTSTWTHSPSADLNGGPFGLLLTDPRNPNRVWGSNGWGFALSNDAMASWMYKGNVRPLAGAVSPADSELLVLTGSAGRVYRSTQASTMPSMDPWPMSQVASSNWIGRSVTFDPTQPQRVYVTGSESPSVVASADAGLTWQAAERAGAGDGLPDGEVTTLQVDPVIGDALYVGTARGLYVSWNVGAVSGDTPVWFEVPTPFRGVPITRLVVRKGNGDSRRLYVFTLGRGIWEADIDVAPFNDVARGGFFDYINALRTAGITGGCGTAPLRYCPTDAVLREQMAVFLLRASHGAAYTPPVGTGLFSDVSAQSGFAPWIEQLAREGITSGCGAGFYCPGQEVSRAQMAVFLLRTKHGAAYVPPAPTGQFADVALDGPMAPWIEQLAREGVTSGCSTSPARYCPDAPVTREQMAVFLVKTFGL